MRQEWGVGGRGVSFRGPEEGSTDGRRDVEMHVQKESREDPACVGGQGDILCTDLTLSLVRRGQGPPTPPPPNTA